MCDVCVTSVDEGTCIKIHVVYVEHLCMYT